MLTLMLQDYVVVDCDALKTSIGDDVARLKSWFDTREAISDH